MNKTQYRRFKLELEAIIQANDPSKIKLAANLVLDSPEEQLNEYRKKFDFMVSGLFERYRLTNQELFDNFDNIWVDTCEEYAEDDAVESIKKIASQFFIVGSAASLAHTTSRVTSILNSYYETASNYCLEWVKKEIK